MIPTQVTFRDLPHSDALELEIREHVAWLERFYPDIVRCRVSVELPHRHRQSGRRYAVRIELSLPGGEPIVINREPSLHGALKDVDEAAHRKETDIGGGHRVASVAVRDAFGAARRRLEDFAREQRGDVKSHDAPGP